MTWNQLTALSAIAALALLPIALLTSPIWGIWLLLERRGRRRRGRRALLPHAERTLVAYCEAMIRGDQVLGFAHVAERMDRFLSAEDSPRGWRNALLLTLMEYAPTLVLGLPFSRRGLAARRRFVDRHLTGASPVFRLLTFGKQLVRMAYYSDDVARQQMGFVPPDERRGHAPVAARGKVR
ncbi:MAG TPA: hypothetical protein ENI87_07395 [bacterium]|nr:hypothetical protein [bacterium]